MLLLKMILRDLVLSLRTCWRTFLCTCAAPLPVLIEDAAVESEESAAGVIVKLKRAMDGREFSAVFRPGSTPTDRRGVNRIICRRFAAGMSGWIHPIVPDGLAFVRQTGWSRVCTRGIELRNLRSVRCERQMIKENATMQMALLNVRSVGNKTFMLNDFIMNNKLDFLFLLETWLKVGDLTPMAELLPRGYSYYNSPRLTGRGGGLMSIFKDEIGCRTISTELYNSFELQTFQIMFTNPVLVALVYRPPKPNKDFVNEFSDFVSRLITQFDCFLIIGDFNVHLCCGHDVVSREFVNMIDSFDLTQWVKGPTHKLGHTLDLVLSFNLHIQDIMIDEVVFSDHKPVFFNVCSCSYKNVRKSLPEKIWSRKINSSTSAEFSILYKDYGESILSETSLMNLSVDELLERFNSVCADILDNVAPLKAKRGKIKHLPWDNEPLRAFRQHARQAERRWKKT